MVVMCFDALLSALLATSANEFFHLAYSTLTPLFEGELSAASQIILTAPEEFRQEN